MCRRGDIYFINFGKSTRTYKQSGIRPAVIVSNNKANEFSPVITVVPLTGKINKKRDLPTHVFIPTFAGNGLKKPSIALAEQVESIDKENLIDKRGTITSKLVMDDITRAIQIQVGVYEEYN